MSRLSSYLLPTLREDPADAEALSHRLMVRAGLIRQLGAGLWTFLPAGYRVVKRVERILREEIDAIGGQEMLMPVLQPAELWRRTGRYEIDELFKLKDRREADLVLAMTHEEVVTFHVAREVRSYRELPMILYHVQTKERDEPRPRAGVLRTREFTMKDSYSFDRDAEGLDRSYELHVKAYDRIFDRCGLRWLPGRGRCRHDGRVRGPRVSGAVRGRGERGGARSRLRGQRRGRLGGAAARRAAPCPGRAARGADAGPDHGGGGLRRARGPCRGGVEGDSRGGRGPRLRGDADPRRSPPQRDQASQRPRRGLSPRSPRGDLLGAWPARVHRARRRRGFPC